MTKTAIATDDGDESRGDLLSELDGLLRKHGHTPETGLQAGLRALGEKLDKLTELTRDRRCSGCCGHSHTYWYPASTGVTYGAYTTVTGAASLPSTYTVSTTPLT